MHRRGLLKLPEPPAPGDDLLDLTKTRPSVTTPIAPPFSQPANNNEMNGVSDFLNDFSAIGAAAPNFAPVTETKNGADNLTWRVENTEYKIEQLLARIAELEKKISN
ncbi:MAG: hypothetical protein AABY16_04595 [Nanoarchaeota archaeon]